MLTANQVRALELKFDKDYADLKKEVEELKTEFNSLPDKVSDKVTEKVLEQLKPLLDK